MQVNSLLPKLIDSHCHIPHSNYPISESQIINEAISEGVEKFIIIGTSLSENLITIQTAEKFENVYCALGIYPHDDLENDLDTLKNKLKDQLKLSNKIVALGEIGIDITNWSGGRTLTDQLELFELQAEIALDLHLPIIIHNRNGDEHVLNLLNRFYKEGRPLTGVAHSFSQDWDFAKKLLDLNFYISFSGMITYPSRREMSETIINVPNNKYLVETDSPYLPPQGHRGEVNYPKYVKIIAEKIAQVRGEPFDQVARDSYSNTCALFGLN